MADKRMPADTARQMIESEKRKVQKQAVNMDTREEYEGFRLPPNMSEKETERYKDAIDERVNLRSKVARRLPLVADDAVESIKGFGRSAADVGKSVLEAATVVPRTKAAIAADPEGAKEFAESVLSGDREAIRTAATEASEGAAEPFATMGDAALSLDAAERGEFGEAAGYAGLVVLPGVLQTLGKSMSKGWLKSATEAGEKIPDEAAKKLEDLAKRVDEGKITDDMQVRRELARVEDDYAADYSGRKPPVDARSVERKMLDEINTRDAFIREGRVGGGKLYRFGDKFIEASSPDEAYELATTGDGFEWYVVTQDLDRTTDMSKKALMPMIKETSPEESAKYFNMKAGVTPGGGREDVSVDELMAAEKFMTLPRAGDTAEDLIKRQQPLTPAESRAIVDNRTSLDLMNVRDRTAGISEGTQALDEEINTFQQSELGNKLLRGSDQDYDRYQQMMEQIKAKYPDEVVKAETYGIRGLPVTRLTVEEVENAGSNTIAKQFVGTRLAQDVLAQLDNVPNKNLDNITSGKTVFGEYAKQYGELLDLSNLSDEQLELLRKRHASVSSPELGAVASFKLERGKAGYYSKPYAEVEDARDRLVALGEAVTRERTKRADIEHLKFQEYVQKRIDESKKGELE